MPALFGPIMNPSLNPWAQALSDRLAKHIPAMPSFGGGATVRADTPPPRAPFAGLPEQAPFSQGVSAPPLEAGESYGELPPSGGKIPGWMSAPPSASFDPSILAPPPPTGAAFNGSVESPAGNFYGAVPHGSLVDLESQINAKSYIDQLFPEQTPEGRLHAAEIEAKTRAITPLRPGEEPPILAAEATASRKKDRAAAEMNSALQDWQSRHDAAVKSLQQQGAHLSKEQLASELQSLEDAFDQERRTISLRYAPELVPGFKGGLSDLE